MSVCDTGLGSLFVGQTDRSASTCPSKSKYFSSVRASWLLPYRLQSAVALLLMQCYRSYENLVSPTALLLVETAEGSHSSNEWPAATR